MNKLNCKSAEHKFRLIIGYFNNNITLNYLLVFIVIFLAHYLIKHNSIISNMLIIDDNFLYAESVYGEFSKKTIYSWVYSFINKALFDPAKVRLLYLFIFSLSGAFTFGFINVFIRKPIVSLLIVILAFLNPSASIIITFINGSYNVLFLFLFAAGVLIYAQALFNVKSQSIGLPTTMLAISSLLLSFSMFLTTNGILLPFALLVLPWWKSKLYLHNRKPLNIILIFLFSLLIIFFILRLAGFSHPYEAIDGRINTDFLFLLKNAISFIWLILKKYYHYELGLITGFKPNHEYAYYILLVLIIFFSALVYFYFRNLNRSKRETNNKSNVNDFDIIPFLFLCLVFSIGPLMPSTISHIWHYFLPGLFLVVLIGIATYSILKLKVVLLIAWIILMYLSVNNLKHQQHYYDQSAKDQALLIEFLNKNKSNWNEEAQLIIRTDKIPLMSNLNHRLRDRNYVRFQAQRPDVSLALIGGDRHINYYPFPSESHKSPGKFQPLFSKEKPLYLYSFDYSTGEWEQFFYLVIIENDNAQLLRTNDATVSLLDEFEITDLPSILEQYHISNNKYFIIRITPDEESIPLLNLEIDSFLSFDNNSAIKEVFYLSDSISTLNYEFILKSFDSESCFSKHVSYSDNCPPMPFLATPIALYQDKINSYSFQIKLLKNSVNTDNWIRFSFDPEQWYKIKFTFNLKEQSISVFINDILFEHIQDVTIDISKVGHITLGCGYLQRFWNGKIAYFRIFDNFDNVYVNLQSNDQ